MRDRDAAADEVAPGNLVEGDRGSGGRTLARCRRLGGRMRQHVTTWIRQLASKCSELFVIF